MIQHIGLGTSPGDKTGTPAREAGQIINNNFDYLKDLIDSVDGFTGESIVPSSTPTGTGVASWVATQAGTYANFGGVVVNANSIAVISRSGAGTFSISQTPLDISSKVNVSDIINTLDSSETNKPASANSVKLTNEKFVTKADLVVGKNLFNYLDSDIARGFLINGSGVLFANSSYSVTGFIPVTAGDSIVSNLGSVGFGNNFYDANKVKISTDTGMAALTVPVGAYFLRKTLNLTAAADISLANIQIEKGTVSTTYEIYKKIISEAQIPNLFLKPADIVDNLTSNDATKVLSAKQGKFLNDNRIVLVTQKNKYNYLDNTLGGHTYTTKAIDNNGVISNISGWIGAEIPVFPSTVYSFKHNNSIYAPNAVGVLAYLNSSKSIISWVDMNSLTAAGGLGGKTLTTPANTAYIFKNVKVLTHDYITDFQIELGASTTFFEIYKMAISESQIPSSIARTSDTGSLIAKNIVFMGDSITADPAWWTANLLQKVSFTSFLNLARSGATWSHLAGTVYDITSTGGSTTADNVIWNQVNKLISKVTNSTAVVPDVVVILCGTNDSNRPIGTAASAFAANYPITGNAPGTILDVSTAVRYDCELILTNYPLCQIILATPLQRGQEDNTTIFNIGQVIKDCGGYLATQIIDAGKESGIYGKKETNLDVFEYDNLHPNSAGNEKIGAFMARKLKNIINI